MAKTCPPSQDVWDTLQCYAVTSDVGNDVLTWDKLLAAAKDSPYIKLSTHLSHQELQLTSLSGLTVSNPTSCTTTLSDGIVLLHDRPLIPVSLRTEVMDHLHAANTGVTGMYA